MLPAMGEDSHCYADKCRYPVWCCAPYNAIERIEDEKPKNKRWEDSLDGGNPARRAGTAEQHERQQATCEGDDGHDGEDHEGVTHGRCVLREAAAYLFQQR